MTTGDVDTFVNVKWANITPKGVTMKTYSIDLSLVDQEKQLLSMQGFKNFFIQSPTTYCRLTPSDFIQQKDYKVDMGFEKGMYRRWTLMHDDGQLILFRKIKDEITS